MLGILTKEQSEQVLRSEVVGRIACYTGSKIYVVPITYVLEDNYLYAHSKEGLKIQIMRQNPNVCFEVDQINNMANWRSVIVWGKYEELKANNQEKAMKILKDRLTPLLLSESVKPTHGIPGPETVTKQVKAVAFRISIKELTGRFEKNG